MEAVVLNLIVLNLSGITRFIIPLELTLIWEFRGTQREILRKRPKNNNKAWIKLSEAILSILGDCWETFICLSSLPSRLKEEFPASKVHLQAATWLTMKSPADVNPDIIGQFGCGHTVENQPFGGYWQIVHTTYTRHQRTKSPQTPWIVYFPAALSLSFQGHIIFSKSLRKERIFWGTDPLGASES